VKYSTKYASFFAMSYKKFTNESHFLLSYWIKVNEIFTRYRGIIYAVNAHIEVAISHSEPQKKQKLFLDALVAGEVQAPPNLPWY